MSQAVLYLALHVLGTAVCFAVGPRRAPALCCALGFPIGLAVTVLLALPILLVGLPGAFWLLMALMVAVFAAAAIRAARRGIDRRAIVIACWWTAIFAVACPAITHFNLSFTSIDSHRLLVLGMVVANDGALDPRVFAQMDRWGVFHVIAHSLVGFARRDYLYALPFALGVTFIPVFALALSHALGTVGASIPRRSLLVGLVTASLFTIGMVDHHMLYIHTNLGSAVYLFGFVVLFWIAEIERDTSWLPLAFISLIAFALQRPETPMVAVLFLALIVSQSELSPRGIRIGLVVFTVIVAGWFELIASHVSADSLKITPTRVRAVVALLVAFLLWSLASRRPLLRRIDRFMPAIVAAGGAVAIAAAFATRPELMLLSVEHWVSNLLEQPLWGWSWAILPVLILFSLLVEPPRFRQAFAVGIPVSLAFVLLLSYYVGRPYRIGLGDSANRMTIHFLPLICFYLAIKLLPALARAKPADDDDVPGQAAGQLSDHQLVERRVDG